MRPWACPWTAQASTLARPMRHTGESYRGINVLLLWSTAQERGYQQNTWLTYKQAEALGGHKLGDLIVEESHTCYEGQRGHRYPWGYGCGQCPACNLREAGYKEYASNK